MKLLLDTHAVVWWWLDDPRLPVTARGMIAATANTVCVSAVSAWEIATKNRLGEWPDVERIVDEFPSVLRRSRFVPMAITVEHAVLAGSLAGAHRDPFDRMLIAQAITEPLRLLTTDRALARYSDVVIVV